MIRPPQDVLGRPIDSLLQTFIQNKHLSGSNYKRLSSKISISNFNKLSLFDYCTAHREYCTIYHPPQCFLCPAMIKAANLVIEAGVCSLHSVFTAAFPSVTYHMMNAKRKLLQMPLVAFQGNKEVFLMELVEGVDYLKVVHFINACMVSNTGSKSMSKLELNKLLLLARTDREKELVKHATFRASGLTKSSARAHFGLEDLSEKMYRIEECIKEVEAIRQSIECLTQVKEKALMRSLGFSESEESEQSSEDESVDDASMFEGEELESNDASISET